jgi:hypothetical protein
MLHALNTLHQLRARDPPTPPPAMHPESTLSTPHPIRPVSGLSAPILVESSRDSHMLRRKEEHVQKDCASREELMLVDQQETTQLSGQCAHRL